MNWYIRQVTLAVSVAGIIGLTPPAAVVVHSQVVQIVKIFDDSGRDITNTWLPEPEQQVRLVAEPAGTITLVGSTTHLGVCTNFTSEAGALPDLELNNDVLVSHDCGGTITVAVNGVTLKLPRDDNNNEIADAWEIQRYGALLGSGREREDLDLSPATTTDAQPTSESDCVGDCRKGDGLSAFDEYRGFIVSNSSPANGVAFAGLEGTKHIRTEPTQKDFFVHVVNEQCKPTSPPLIHGTFARYFQGGQDMFDFTHTLISSTQVHLLDFTPGAINPKNSVLWEDFFDRYTLSVVTTPSGRQLVGVLFTHPTDVVTDVEPPTDRQINRFAKYPLVDLEGLRRDPPITTTVQRGMRLIECQVIDTNSTLGANDWGTPNFAGNPTALKAGNSVVFPERIRKDIQTKISNAGNRKLRWAVYNPSTAQWVLQSNELPKDQATQDFLTSRHVRFTIGHELIHSAQLRPSSTNGYHSTAGSGSLMDQQIQFNMDKSRTGNATFYIPSTFLTSDQQEIKFHH